LGFEPKIGFSETCCIFGCDKSCLRSAAGAVKEKATPDWASVSKGGFGEQDGMGMQDCF
jgi:hypothetical protein